MTTIFSKLLYELEKQHDTVLVTIISKAGSTPRGIGSQMLVGRQGRLVGTIGGGAVEQRSEQMAMELLREKRSAQHSFLLRQNDTEDIGMVCGGDVSVWFQMIEAAEADWPDLAGQLLSQLSVKKTGWLVQKLDGSFPSLLDERGAPLAGAPVEGLPAPAANTCILTDAYFAMPLPVRDRAVIFGGGHCAQALVPILNQVGFSATVMDNRPEYADPALFPQADRVVCGDYLRIADTLTLLPSDYVVIMTSGHSHDFEVQAQVLRNPPVYVGVIGSRSKKAFVEMRLREAGIEEAAIRRIHTPVGTAIKAVTPEEIAVSIAGEMIYERALLREAGGTGRHGCPMN